MASSDTRPSAGGGGAKLSSATVSLPKGGGAIRSIGEKFAVNAVNGSATLGLPLPVSPCRGGFMPDLHLAYDSAAGNGPFGMGWVIDAPAITRRTDKGLPRYHDGDESDIFVLAGAEDLVPLTDSGGTRVTIPRTLHTVDYDVFPYRPRIEGIYAQIERWVERSTGLSHWRTITNDNITTLYGIDATSRIAPDDSSTRIFSYTMRRRFDGLGNLIVYDYAEEDDTAVDLTATHEANRLPEERTRQRYLKAARYGFTTPYFADWSETGAEPPLPADWHFELVLDYGQCDADLPRPSDAKPRPVRPDPFSSQRPGFEVRTYRRCERVLMFHHFELEPNIGRDCLVRALEFQYSDELTVPDPDAPIYSMLASITQIGVKRDGGGYLRGAMPPVEFEYAKPLIDPSIHTLDRDSIENLPEGLDGAHYRFVDLEAEGMPGILSDEGGAWRYRRNLSPLTGVPLPDGTSPREIAMFEPMGTVATLPSSHDLRSGVQLLDLRGEGRLDAVSFDPASPGYWTRDPEAGWQSFQAFRSRAVGTAALGETHIVDLTGDGRPDLLVGEDHLWVMHPSLGVEGYAQAELVAAPWDERVGGAPVASTALQGVHLADMSGDGLADIVRVRNGETCFWPNLGYGKFGRKVTMGKSPLFAPPDQFDPRRVRLADIDGSGTTDMLYVGEDGVSVWFNQSGNNWAEPQRIAVFPSADRLSNVQTADLLGNGTACLIWSTPLHGQGGAPIRYIDLMSGRKPHLLASTRNNLGAETRLHYAPSTRFYLQDRRAGRPWVTRLPFPVQVVERVEVFDWVARSRFVTRYAYHHGHYDGPEREFRGFGMVETWDTDEHRSDTAFPTGENWDVASWSPPVRTRSWFHTGAFVEQGLISKQFAHEYWIEPALRPDARAADRAAMTLPDSVIPAGLDAAEAREACRALKGRPLRTETYADDGGTFADLPYQVTEHNYTVRRLQPIGANRHGVYSAHAREALTFHYERCTDDPRVGHEIVLEVDEFDNVLRSVSVLYPRRTGVPEPEPALTASFRQMLAYDQARLHVTATFHDLTNAVLLPDDHRTPQPAETIQSEWTGCKPLSNRAGITNIFRFDEVDALWATISDGTHDIPYEELPGSDIDGSGVPAATATRRIVEQVRTVYRADDLSALLPLGSVEALALPGRNYHLAFTPGVLARTLAGLAGAAELTEGGYQQLAGHSGWWIPSPVVRFSPGDADDAATERAFARQHFFMIRRTIDPFGGISRNDYDGYSLLAVLATDPVGNTHGANNDYRVLEPWRVTDPNGNRADVAFDALGMVVGSAIRGKASETLGDTLVGFDPDFDDPTIAAHIADPLNNPQAILKDASACFLYDVGAYYRTRNLPQPQPTVSYLLTRETHVSDLAPGEESRYRHEFIYSNGQGHQIQHKAQAEAGPLVEGGPDVAPRWVGTGWVIEDNKGHPVREYDPFFSATHHFEFAPINGVSHIFFHDALGRSIATLHPNNLWDKVVFGAWHVEHWDGSDTVLIPDPRGDPDVGGHFARLMGGAPFTSWYDLRATGTFGSDAKDKAAEQDAALKTAVHAATPGFEHLDTAGRVCLRIMDFGVGGRQPLRTAHDAEGEPIATIDALGRRVVEYAVREPAGPGFRYIAARDLTGRELFSAHMDSGPRRMLPDITGLPIRSWDERGHVVRRTYDLNRRPVGRYVSTGGGPEHLSAYTVYGEGRPQLNMCGEIFRHYDQAGLTANDSYDFKSNLVDRSRHLAVEYRDEIDWSVLAGETDPTTLDTLGAPLLVSADLFVARSIHDALNRPVQAVTPHSATMHPNVIRATFNEGNKVDRVDVWEQVAVAPSGLLDPTTADIHAVLDIDYDARGERTAIFHGNGTVTRREVDPFTKRVVRIFTTRPASFPVDTRVVQDLRYTYDPAGNVTRLRDEADTANVVFFRNRRVEPSSDYTYDAGRRLIRASGREHLGLTGLALSPPQQSGPDNGGSTGLLHPGDGNAVGTYIETYDLDGVGNLLSMFHQTASGQWRRRYHYGEASSIDAAQNSNRLSTTSKPTDPAMGPFTDLYQYDAHGNMVVMPHLPSMTWDERDMLQSTARQVVMAGTPETSHYRYDATDHRIRKVTDRPGLVGPGTRKSERIYLGAFELYREYAADGVTLTLERETQLIVAERKTTAVLERRTLGSDPAPARVLKYQHINLNGSSSLELDDNAAIISYEEYFPYGGTAYQAVRTLTETPKRLRYQGLERDVETGFYYCGARYYAPWLGRWISPDPEGIGDGPDVYQYCHSNPVVVVDPSGTVGLVLGGLTLYELAALGLFATAATGIVATNAARHPPRINWHPFSSGEEWADPPTHPPIDIPVRRPPPPISPPIPAPPPAPPVPAPPVPAPAPPVPVPAPPIPIPVPPIPIPVPPIPIPVPPIPIPIPIPHNGPRPVPKPGPKQDPKPKPKPGPKPGPGPHPIPGPKPKPPRDKQGRVLRYVTYRKYNRTTGQVYVGRTRGYGDPRAIVAARDINHHMTAQGFGPARLDRYTDATLPLGMRWLDPAYQAMRGREQQLIDSYGGALSDGRPGSRSGNAIRGVAKDNPLGRVYHGAASAAFGQRAPYTGH